MKPPSMIGGIMGEYNYNSQFKINAPLLAALYRATCSLHGIAVIAYSHWSREFFSYHVGLGHSPHITLHCPLLRVFFFNRTNIQYAFAVLWLGRITLKSWHFVRTIPLMFSAFRQTLRSLNDFRSLKGQVVFCRLGLEMLHLHPNCPSPEMSCYQYRQKYFQMVNDCMKLGANIGTSMSFFQKHMARGLLEIMRDIVLIVFCLFGWDSVMKEIDDLSTSTFRTPIFFSRQCCVHIHILMESIKCMLSKKSFRPTKPKERKWQMPAAVIDFYKTRKQKTKKKQSFA